MRFRKRDGFFLLLGLWIGAVFIAPMSVFAQVPTAVGAAASGTLPLDQGTAAAVTKFIVDLVKRAFAGDRKTPSIVTIGAVVITGPLVVALLLLKDRVNLADIAVIAGVIVTGLFVAGGGAALLTMAHDEARRPEHNVPTTLARVPKPLRSELCCLHPDCRHLMTGNGESMTTVGPSLSRAAPGVMSEATQPFTGTKG